MTQFNHRLPPVYGVADQAYIGELARQADDAAYYSQKVAGALQQNPANPEAAFFDAMGAIAYAGTLAVASVDHYSNPRWLMSSFRPYVLRAEQGAQQALEALEARAPQSDLWAELALIQPFIEPMILYRALCLYGGKSRAKALRMEYVETARPRVVAALSQLVGNRSVSEAKITGTIHEACTLALLNERKADALALPTFAADNNRRQTDIVYIANHPGQDPTLQYVQAKTQAKSQEDAPHQATIENKHVGNTHPDKPRETERIILENDTSPEADEHLRRYRTFVMDALRRNSTRFSLTI